MRFEDKIRSLLLGYPGSVTSWIRSPSRNKLVGGAVNSKHLIGLAIDIVLDNPADNFAFIQTAQSMGLWTLDEGDHVHVHEKF